jgi:hypothetical protein
LAALLLGLYQMHTRLQDLEQAHQQRGQGRPPTAATWSSC